MRLWHGLQVARGEAARVGGPPRAARPLMGFAMTRSIPSTLSCAFLAATLCACAGDGKSNKPEENILPTDYKPGILDQIRARVDDPTDIRDAYITAPALRAHAGYQRYVVCIRFNAKASDGQYAGNKEVAAFFYSGQMTQIVDAGPELCGGAAYQPFPELQKLCRELVCNS